MLLSRVKCSPALTASHTPEARLWPVTSVQLSYLGLINPLVSRLLGRTSAEQCKGHSGKALEAKCCSVKNKLM